MRDNRPSGEGQSVCPRPRTTGNWNSQKSTSRGRAILRLPLPNRHRFTNLLSVGGWREFREALQFLPLVHQIAHLPHERLVPLDERLRRGAVVIEAWRGHRPFELAN